jgi:hypothetical protein
MSRRVFNVDRVLECNTPPTTAAGHSRSCANSVGNGAMRSSNLLGIAAVEEGALAAVAALEGGRQANQ